jgi:hypothetical protein
MFGGRVFQQTVGIQMGTYCATERYMLYICNAARMLLHISGKLKMGENKIISIAVNILSYPVLCNPVILHVHELFPCF